MQSAAGGWKSSLTLLTLSGALLVGCGGDRRAGTAVDESARSKLSTLAIAAAGRPTTVDPLTTETSDGLELSRQIHEPLVMKATAARGRRSVSNLVTSWQRSKNSKVWIASLRRGVKFQDGSVFNAEAVVVNVRRWLTTTAGRGQVSVIRKATAPGTLTVRFALKEPAGEFTKVLRHPRLALVSPRALDPPSGRNAKLSTLRGTGTGPFFLRKVEIGQRTRMTLNHSWWALRYNIEPAVGSLIFNWQPDELKRIRLLQRGDASLVTAVSHLGMARLEHDPNVQFFKSPGRHYAGARWLKELRLSALGAESLAGVWLTRTGQ